VLDCEVAQATARFDLSGELHVELPPGVALDSPQLDQATSAAIERVERQG
jgi:hypothetical protein